VMQVRGAPLIGATAAYGVCLGLREDQSDAALEVADRRLRRTRPTAINLMWALDEMLAALRNRPRSERLATAYARAAQICDADVATNRAIGEQLHHSEKTFKHCVTNILEKLHVRSRVEAAMLAVRGGAGRFE